jgi:hypothetical protein
MAVVLGAQYNLTLLMGVTIDFSDESVTTSSQLTEVIKQYRN